MAENDVPEAIQAAAEVAELVSPTASDLWRVLHGYTPEAMAAAVAGLGGGGQPSWLMDGSGSPVDAVTPIQQGAVYVDTTNGAVYLAIGPTDADWVILGASGNVGEATGLYFKGAAREAYLLAGERDTQFDGVNLLGDAYSWWNGNALGLYWEGNGTDGEQVLKVKTGVALFSILADAAGNITPAGTIILPDPTNDQEGATKAYVDAVAAAPGGIVPQQDNDAVIAQGSGTIVKAAAAVDYTWQRVGDAVTVSFLVTLDSGTAGELGTTIFVTLPTPPPPPGAGSQMCGVTQFTVGGVAGVGFIVASQNGGQTRLAVTKLDAGALGGAEALAPADVLSGNFTYFTDAA